MYMHIDTHTHSLDRVSLCSPGWLRTHDPPASASRVLGLDMYQHTRLIFDIFPSKVKSKQHRKYNKPKFNELELFHSSLLLQLQTILHYFIIETKKKYLRKYYLEN
jgi:hypothetical protein